MSSPLPRMGEGLGEGASIMPYLSKYHITEQPAEALLGPLAAALRELEGRAHHYAERINMTDEDRDVMLAAHRVLAGASAQLAQVRDGGR